MSRRISVDDDYIIKFSELMILTGSSDENVRKLGIDIHNRKIADINKKHIEVMNREFSRKQEMKRRNDGEEFIK